MRCLSSILPSTHWRQSFAFCSIAEEEEGFGGTEPAAADGDDAAEASLDSAAVSLVVVPEGGDSLDVPVLPSVGELKCLKLVSCMDGA